MSRADEQRDAISKFAIRAYQLMSINLKFELSAYSVINFIETMAKGPAKISGSS